MTAPSDGEQKWVFGKINEQVEQLKAEQVKVKALLDEERAELADLADIWGGTGSEAFQAEQRRFQDKADKVNETLAQLVAAAAGAADTMKATENNISGMFN